MMTIIGIIIDINATAASNNNFVEGSFNIANLDFSEVVGFDWGFSMLSVEPNTIFDTLPKRQDILYLPLNE